MRRKMVERRWSVVLVLVGLLFALQGCQSLGPVGTYFQHRAEDMLEVVDVGLTYSDTPQFAFYWNSLDAFPIGYSDFDGWFIGWGGGQLGMTRLYNNCWGLGYGYEKVGWGDFDKNDESTLYIRSAGIIGIIVGATTDAPDPAPSYTPACVHFFPHVGYLGFVWNARYMEMVDFALGWFGIDICGDDGVKVGKWTLPWESAEPEESEAPEPPAGD